MLRFGSINDAIIHIMNRSEINSLHTYLGVLYYAKNVSKIHHFTVKETHIEKLWCHAKLVFIIMKSWQAPEPTDENIYEYLKLQCITPLKALLGKPYGAI